MRAALARESKMSEVERMETLAMGGLIESRTRAPRVFVASVLRVGVNRWGYVCV